MQYLPQILHSRRGASDLQTILSSVFPLSLKTFGFGVNLMSNENLANALAGFCAGATTTLLLHPLDLIKIRFQVAKELPSQHLLSSSKILSTARLIIQQQGWRGLYRGWSPNFVGSTISWGLYFGCYSYMKDCLRAESTIKLGPIQHMLAAAAAGGITITLTNPIWVVKTRMCGEQQNLQQHQYKSLRDGLLRLFRNEGVRGLYKGYIPSLFGIAHGAFQFMAYEELKYLTGRKKLVLGTIDYLMIAAGSKIFATLATYPYQLIRSRIQFTSSSNNVKEAILDTFRAEGLKGFYKGLFPSLLRVLPATCITFVVYEHAKIAFQPISASDKATNST